MRIRQAVPADREQRAELFRFSELAPDDRIVDRGWGWILDDTHEVGALVAETDDGSLVGPAHHRAFARPSSGTTGLCFDDLFTTPEPRGAGVGTALVTELTSRAAADGRSMVRWITAETDASARRVSDTVARATLRVTSDAEPC